MATVVPAGGERPDPLVKIQRRGDVGSLRGVTWRGLAWRSMLPNQASTKLNQEIEVGVECIRNRGFFVLQALTLGVLCTA